MYRSAVLSVPQQGGLRPAVSPDKTLRYTFGYVMLARQHRGWHAGRLTAGRAWVGIGRKSVRGKGREQARSRQTMEGQEYRKSGTGKDRGSVARQGPGHEHG